MAPRNYTVHLSDQSASVLNSGTLYVSQTQGYVACGFELPLGVEGEGYFMFIATVLSGGSLASPIRVQSLRCIQFPDTDNQAGWENGQ